jgi:hypothetical protein
MEIKVKKISLKKVDDTKFVVGQIVRLFFNNNSYYAIIPYVLDDTLSIYDPRSKEWRCETWTMIRKHYLYEIIDTLTFVEE